MGKTIDISGQRYGRLIAIKRIGNKRYPGGGTLSIWECECDCGNTVRVPLCALRNHNTESCGCLHREMMTDIFAVHGESHSRLNELWKGMKARCYNPKHKSYKWYGAKGVEVCDEWKESFQSFKEWMISNGYDPEAPRGVQTIDRIDPSGNYEPNNCRLISIQEQQKNKRKKAC